MTSLTTLLRTSLTLCVAGFLGGLALSACDLPDKDLGEDPPAGSEGGECVDGDTQMQDCNTCTCENGAWACTEIGCGTGGVTETGDGSGDTGDSGVISCDPETEPVDECNTCECEAGEWVCTAIGCETTTGDECIDGDTMMQDCNECFCEDGAWACTDLACPEDPPVEVCDGTEPSDALFIDGAAIAGDILTLNVSYSGGCSNHWFGSCWDENFLESNPVQAGLTINHEDNDDPCDAIEAQDITFDLTPLRTSWNAQYGPGSGTILVNVSGYGMVEYSF